MFHAKDELHMKSPRFSIFQKATDMAAKAHEGQTIRDTEVPYISHPVRVAAAVMTVFRCMDAEVGAAAVLHDTLEKTALSEEEIGIQLGERVLALVIAMTKTDAMTKVAYWKQLEKAPWEARLLKMGDALDHLDCPVKDLPRRIKSGRRALLLAFSDEGPIRTAKAVLRQQLAEAERRISETRTRH